MRFFGGWIEKCLMSILNNLCVLVKDWYVSRKVLLKLELSLLCFVSCFIKVKSEFFLIVGGEVFVF